METLNRAMGDLCMETGHAGGKHSRKMTSSLTCVFVEVYQPPGVTAQTQSLADHTAATTASTSFFSAVTVCQ
jgi:hypothetical protein